MLLKERESEIETQRQTVLRERVNINASYNNFTVNSDVNCITKQIQISVDKRKYYSKAFDFSSFFHFFLL